MVDSLPILSRASKEPTMSCFFHLRPGMIPFFFSIPDLVGGPATILRSAICVLDSRFHGNGLQ